MKILATSLIAALLLIYALTLWKPDAALFAGALLPLALLVSLDVAAALLLPARGLTFSFALMWYLVIAFSLPRAIVLGAAATAAASLFRRRHALADGLSRFLAFAGGASLYACTASLLPRTSFLSLFIIPTFSILVALFLEVRLRRITGGTCISRPEGGSSIAGYAPLIMPAVTAPLAGFLNASPTAAALVSVYIPLMGLTLAPLLEKGHRFDAPQPADAGGDEKSQISLLLSFNALLWQKLDLPYAVQVLGNFLESLAPFTRCILYLRKEEAFELYGGKWPQGAAPPPDLGAFAHAAALVRQRARSVRGTDALFEGEAEFALFPVAWERDIMGLLYLGFEKEGTLSDQTRTFIETLTRQFSLVLKNVQLFASYEALLKSLAEANRQLDATTRGRERSLVLSRSLAQARGRDELLAAAALFVEEQIGPRSLAFFLRDGGFACALCRSPHGARLPLAAKGLDEGLADEAVRTGEPWVERHAPPDAARLLAEERTFVLCPLGAGPENLGALYLGFESPEACGREDVLLASLAASLTTLALRGVRTPEGPGRRRDEAGERRP